MRYSEISILPGTPQEAKNVIMDILTAARALDNESIPLSTVLKSLHKQNFDIDRRMLIDLVKDESPVDRITDGLIFFKKASSPDDELETISDEEEQKSKEKVEQMAKKALKKKKGE